MKIPLPRGKIELKFDKKVYSPLRTSVDVLVLGHWFVQDGMKIVDVGTGSGYYALGMKKMHPKVEVVATDLYKDSLETTKKNAKLNKLEVEVLQGDLLIPDGVDMILSNLPTYSKDQENLPLYGPPEAYFDEWTLYPRLFHSAAEKLKPGGYLIVECQEIMLPKLQALAEETNFHLLTRNNFGFAFINPTRVVKK